MANTAINTFSRRLLDFDDPSPDSIELKDIAHGLSFLPRFGAQAQEAVQLAGRPSSL